MYYCGELQLNIVEHPMCSIKMKVAVIPRHEETAGLLIVAGTRSLAHGLGIIIASLRELQINIIQHPLYSILSL